LGASALMQGLADGYFVLPYTIAAYLSDEIHTKRIPTDTKEFTDAEKGVNEIIEKFKSINGKQSVDTFHKKLGKIMWEYCGMGRNEAGLKKALELIPELRKEFWKDVKIPGELDEFNPEIEKAGRVADYLELSELMVRDALNRKESCGGHFREEMQTEEGEAKRDDDNFAYVAAWEFKGIDKEPVLHKEQLEFNDIKIAQRNYK